MSNEVATAAPPVAKHEATKYRHLCSQIASTLLEDWVGHDRAGEATGRLSCALASAAAAARNPSDFYKCTPQSIGTVIAVAALTGIMPGTGALSLAYVIPRRPRRGEPPQLNFQLSHRGIAALARRCGQSLVAIPLSMTDVITVDESGDVDCSQRDIDGPPTTWEELRGVAVIVKDIASGIMLSRAFVPKKVIEERRAGSDSYVFACKNEYAQATDPWHKYPVEMAMKTAMHYSAARGWCVIDDTNAVRAMSIDTQSAVIEGTVAKRQTLSDLTDELSAEETPVIEGEDVTPASAEGQPADEKEPAVAKDVTEAAADTKPAEKKGSVVDRLKAELAKLTDMAYLQQVRDQYLKDEDKKHHAAIKKTCIDFYQTWQAEHGDTSEN